MNRRGLLRGILAAGMAPMVVKAGVLMPVKKILTPIEFGHIENFRYYESSMLGTTYVQVTKRAIARAQEEMLRHAQPLTGWWSRDGNIVTVGDSFVLRDRFDAVRGAADIRGPLTRI
jgi:hypothetical protein